MDRAVKILLFHYLVQHNFKPVF